MAIVLPPGALSAPSAFSSWADRAVADILSARALSAGALSARALSASISVVRDDFIPFIKPASISLVLKYDIIAINDFGNFLDSNTIIAGSFALASYLIQEGVEVDFEPNDVDIFVSTEKFGGVDNFIEKITDFMSLYDYTAHEEGWAGGDYDIGTEIKRVVSFKNRAINKKIQIIVVQTLNLTEYIKTFFDLSVCATWWNSKEYRFETLDPEHTLRKEMYTLDLWIDIVKSSRVQKYTDRGFTSIHKPCPVISDRDLRLDLDNDKFSDIVVHNIFTLEESPIRDFLRESRWNIILKAGEQYYGFDRAELMKYMATKKTYVRRIDDEVYETPFKQCITTEAFIYLGYGDYTIYELDTTITVTVHGVVKSLFHLVCYSVSQWVNNSVGMLLSPVICV
jgi:hypothetical protein